MNIVLYIVGGFAWAGSALLLATAWVAAVDRSAAADRALDSAAIVFLIGLLAVALGSIVGLLKRIAANGVRLEPVSGLDPGNGPGVPKTPSSAAPQRWPE
jgi:hypothetical protein